MAIMMLLLALAAVSIFFAVTVSIYGLLVLFGARRLTRFRLANGVIAVACGVLFASVSLSGSHRVPLLYLDISVVVLVLTTLFIAVARLNRLKGWSASGSIASKRLSSRRRAALGVSVSCVVSLLVLAALPVYLLVAPRVEAAKNDRIQEKVLEKSPLESVYDIDRTELATGNDADIAFVDTGYAPGLQTTYSVGVAGRPASREGGLQYIRVLQYADGFGRRMEECADNDNIGDPAWMESGDIYCEPLLVTPEGREVRIYGYVNASPTVAERRSFFVRLEDDSYAIVDVDYDLSENGLVGKGRRQFDLVSAIDALEAVPKEEFKERASGNYIDAY